jgi:hypothetical protein
MEIITLLFRLRDDVHDSKSYWHHPQYSKDCSQKYSRGRFLECGICRKCSSHTKKQETQYDIIHPSVITFSAQGLSLFVNNQNYL